MRLRECKVGMEVVVTSGKFIGKRGIINKTICFTSGGWVTINKDKFLCTVRCRDLQPAPAKKATSGKKGNDITTNYKGFKIGEKVVVKSGKNIGRCGNVTYFSPFTGTVVSVDNGGLKFFENYKNLTNVELPRQDVASGKEWLKPQHTFLITYRHGNLFEAESIYPATDVVDAIAVSRTPREAIVSIVRIK